MSFNEVRVTPLKSDLLLKGNQVRS